MNAKKVKVLRQLARKMASSSHGYVKTNVQVKTMRVPTPFGIPKVVTYETSTLVLEPRCARSIYQTLKKRQK